MQEYIDIHELFDKYIKKELSDSEIIAFNQRLNNDESFKQEFGLYKDIVTGINIASEDYLRGKFNELDNKSVFSGKRVMTFMYLAAAVVLVAVVGTGIVIKMNQKQQHDDIIASNEQNIVDDDSNTQVKPEPEKIQAKEPDNNEKLLAMNTYKDNYKQYPNKLVPKSRGEIPKDSLPLAMYYYDNQDYSKAELLLSKLLISQPGNEDIRFYLAMSKMATPDVKGALEILLALEKEKSTKYYYSVVWYSGLVYLQSNDIAKAINQFEKITAQNNPYKASSEEILKLLKK